MEYADDAASLQTAAPRHHDAGSVAPRSAEAVAALAYSSGVLERIEEMPRSRILAYVACALGGSLIVGLYLWRRWREPLHNGRSGPWRRVRIFAIPHEPGLKAQFDRDRSEHDRVTAAFPSHDDLPLAEMQRPHRRALAPGPKPVWTTYRFFLLNSGGVIESARESAHTGVDAALSHARSLGRNQTVEVWADDHKIATID